MENHNNIKVLTLNTHKGFNSFSTKFVLHELRDALRLLKPDIVFLQEVVGEHARHAEKHEAWPTVSQYEFLADQVWSEYAYGKNAVYPQGHHGNAILSKFPIINQAIKDVSTNRVEQRGILYAKINLPGTDKPLHCLCVHLGLIAYSRRKQMRAICDYLEKMVPRGEPVIVAGDFNDWTLRSVDRFLAELGFSEAFLSGEGRFTRTFPAWFPILKLDRIYCRDVVVKDSTVLKGAPWSKLTDHLALTASLKMGTVL